NLLGRSARFIEDTKRFSALRRIAWLEERTWELIKASPRLEGRLEKVANWISDIRHVPGAKVFTECMAARLHLVDVEGYLFQLQRAAEYARKDELVAIGKRFHTDVALPGRPIRRITGEADLELRGGVLVETKFRSTPLTLDEGLHLQLLKYDRAVAEGQFKSIRLECNNAVSMAVRERCSMLSNAVDIADNLVENVEPLRASHGVG
ncbi:MAG: hypothetical protein JWM57_3898, partial [Phycisphaerales bacterium]|nr:hypothetical protein [Phycisphaerales bacterium]